MSEFGQHSNDKIVGKHRERSADRRHVSHDAVRDALPDELQQRTVDKVRPVYDNSSTDVLSMSNTFIFLYLK